MEYTPLQMDVICSCDLGAMLLLNDRLTAPRDSAAGYRLWKPLSHDG